MRGSGPDRWPGPRPEPLPPPGAARPPLPPARARPGPAPPSDTAGGQWGPAAGGRGRHQDEPAARGCGGLRGAEAPSGPKRRGAAPWAGGTAEGSARRSPNGRLVLETQLTPYLQLYFLPFTQFRSI